MKEIFVRLDRCTGCKTCEIYCRVEHSQSKDLFKATLEQPLQKRCLFVEMGPQLKTPVLCRMCQDAPCLHACIAGALYREKETGLVLHNADKCIGCWTCIMACPYGVIGRMPRGDKWVSLKCDRCHESPLGPACVRTCPAKALVYAEPEEFALTRRQTYVQAVGQAAQAQ